MFPMNYSEIAKTRREDFLREAEQERLVKIAQAGQSTLIGRMQIKVGEILKTTVEGVQNQTQSLSNPNQSVLKS